MHVKTCAGISCKTNMDEYVNYIVVHKVWPKKVIRVFAKNKHLINRFRHLLLFFKWRIFQFSLFNYWKSLLIFWVFTLIYSNTSIPNTYLEHKKSMYKEINVTVCDRSSMLRLNMDPDTEVFESLFQTVRDFSPLWSNHPPAQSLVILCEVKLEARS